MLFDTISVKARWERWCRWNCDLRVINAPKKGIFCRTESVAMTPKSCDHMPTTSLWGVAAKWLTRAPKTKLILCPRDPQGYSRISLSLSGRILKEYWKIMSALKQTPCDIPWVCEIALTEVLATQMGVMWCSKNIEVSLFELYKLNPLSPHCRSIERELVHCYTWGRLQIVTVRGNTVGRHSWHFCRPHAYTVYWRI